MRYKYMDPKCILEEIIENQDGNFYFIFKVPNVKRGIRGKNRGKVDELLIVGVNRAHAVRFARKNGIKLILSED